MEAFLWQFQTVRFGNLCNTGMGVVSGDGSQGQYFSSGVLPGNSGRKGGRGRREIPGVSEEDHQYPGYFYAKGKKRELLPWSASWTFEQ